MLGTLPQWACEEDRLAALQEFERDAHSASTREAMHAKLRTVDRALAAWGLDPYPLALLASGARGHLEAGGLPFSPVLFVAL